MSTRTQMNKGKWVFAIIMLALLLAGCASNNGEGNGGQAGNKTNDTPSTAPAHSSNTGNEAASKEEPVELTYWVGLNAAAARSLKDYSEALFYQELEKRTNVKVKFEHPAVGSENEQFNLMIASSNLPDVIESDFTRYSGGPEKAISDGVLIPLNDLIDEHAPNLKQYLDEHPDMRKEISTDDGTLYVFPSLGAGSANVSSGMMLRADWLEELNLEVPETIEEWTHVLREFRDKKASSAPLTVILNDLNQDRFNGAFGIGVGFYQDQGQVKYGPAEPAYKDYLALLNGWYEEGLLDPDFATQDSTSRNAKITDGRAGSFPGAIGGGMGTYLNAVEESNPAFDLIAAQHPVMNKGEEPRFFVAAYNYRGQGAAGITPANPHPEATAAWLDYLYSEEGHVLKSYGIEGETFNWEGDFPRYTDLITNNPEGLSISEAMAKYLRVSTPSPGFVGDDAYSDQYYAYERQREAREVFNKYYDNTLEVRMPRVTETPEEGQELSAIMAEINTYQSEMFLKFIMGGESLDNFDRYVEQLNKMKLERAIAIKQAALERYNAR